MEKVTDSEVNSTPSASEPFQLIIQTSDDLLKFPISKQELEKLGRRINNRLWSTRRQ